MPSVDKPKDDEASTAAEAAGSEESEGGSGEASKPERPLADKVEDTIRAFLGFVRSYTHTLRFALLPRKLAGYHSGLHEKDKLRLRPLTFLGCSFLPAAVVLDVTSDTIWDFLISPETAAANIAERLQTISPVKVVLGGDSRIDCCLLGISSARENRGKERETARHFYQPAVLRVWSSVFQRHGPYADRDPGSYPRCGTEHRAKHSSGHRRCTSRRDGCFT